MEATAFLALAAQIAQEGLPEHIRPAAFRTATSRAYYAAYHTTHQFLVSLQCPREVEAFTFDDESLARELRQEGSAV